MHSSAADPEIGTVNSLGPRRDIPSSIANPVRPTEFSLWVALPFVSLFVLLAIGLGIIFQKAHANGTPKTIQLQRSYDLLKRDRSALAIFEHHRTKHSRKLHSHCYSYID
jgi:hypothetical protein